MTEVSVNNKVILFSHGFGIRKDNLGLFDLFAERFQKLGYKTVQFDYYEYNEATKEVYTFPFSKHAEVLQEKINTVIKENPNSEISIVAQSQNSIIPAFCNIESIKRVIGISPFFLTNKEEVYKRYASRPGSDTNFESTSRRKHSDGMVTVIPPEYWIERFNTKVEEMYNKLANKTELTLIYGLEDNLVKSANLELLSGMKVFKLPGDHDFTGESREELYNVVLDQIVGK